MSSKLRVGVAGPVGSGKTALVETLCLSMKKNYEIAVVTNDIYTKEDANFLINKKVLEEGRIIGVETGGCPHTAIREDCSLNKNAVLDLENKYNPLDFVFVEVCVQSKNILTKNLDFDKIFNKAKSVTQSVASTFGNITATIDEGYNEITSLGAY